MKTGSRQTLLATGRPRSLSGLMGLYEHNYAMLQRLLPYREPPFNEAVSHSALDVDLHLCVVERCKYTTTIHLTYWFEQGDKKIADPDLSVRLYHDTAQAEALHCNHRPRCVALRNFDFQTRSVLQAQWGRNQMLNKWLDYLLQHGHGFIKAK